MKEGPPEFGPEPQRTHDMATLDAVPVRKLSKPGRIVLFTLVVFILWAALVPLSKGVVASGVVVVDSKRKTIQHLEGGVIKAIHVKDGTRVEQGSSLIELDDTKARSDRDVIRARFHSRLATSDRLLALLNEEASLQFSDELLRAGRDREVLELTRMHQSVFRVLRAEQAGKRSIAMQRVGQLEQKLLGLDSYRENTQRQVALLEEETRRIRELHGRRLVESSAVVERMQQLAQAQGELGKTLSGIAETRIAIGEARLNDLQVEREWKQDLSRQLTEAQEALIELRSQLNAAENVLARTVVKAPISGVVLGLKATTLGGVLASGSPIMDVVPEGDALVVDARLRPLDVNAVHQRMRAHVKFSSSKTKTMPDIEGFVESVSADVLTDQAKGESYYLIKVVVSSAELKKLGNIEVLPGMPADVFVDGGSRTLLQYLSDPIMVILQRSLREE